MRLDRSLDDLRLLLQKCHHLRPYEVGREPHRFVGAGLVLEDAEGRTLASPRIQPVVADETLGLADDRLNWSWMSRSISALSFWSKW